MVSRENALKSVQGNSLGALRSMKHNLTPLQRQWTAGTKTSDLLEAKVTWFDTVSGNQPRVPLLHRFLAKLFHRWNIRKWTIEVKMRRGKRFGTEGRGCRTTTKSSKKHKVGDQNAEARHKPVN